jgi:HD domain-containing protein
MNQAAQTETSHVERLPQTPLVRDAYALARAALDADLVHHSLRVFALGRAWAHKDRIDFDEEGLCLAALFHDLGMSPGRRPRGMPFTRAGSSALRSFLEERGAPRDRIEPLVVAIDFHMQLLPRWSKGPVAGLLQVAAWMDVTGLRRSRLGAEAKTIEEALPVGNLRRDFNRRFLGTIDSFRGCLDLFFPRSSIA